VHGENPHRLGLQKQQAKSTKWVISPRRRPYSAFSPVRWMAFQLRQSSLIRMRSKECRPALHVDGLPAGRLNRHGQGLGEVMCRRKISRAAPSRRTAPVVPTQKGMPACWTISRERCVSAQERSAVFRYKPVCAPPRPLRKSAREIVRRGDEDRVNLGIAMAALNPW